MSTVWKPHVWSFACQNHVGLLFAPLPPNTHAHKHTRALTLIAGRLKWPMSADMASTPEKERAMLPKAIHALRGLFLKKR